jgi:leucine dehydrogenase
VFEELLRDWDGEEVALRFDAASGAWMFICVHSTVLGPAMGGVRLQRYATPHDALGDGLRLAGAMTLKQAAADLPYGGGKAVLSVPDIPSGSTRHTLFDRYADLVTSMGGTYVTAADMNTGQSDMDVVGERCSYVLGRSPERGGSGDPAPSTATGVFHGIVATALRAYGSADLAGRTVLVQGVGAVGLPLAAMLRDADARVILADPNEDRVAAYAERLGASIVWPDEVIGTECDVFAPCATGGILSAESIPTLRCSVVAGAANNQLATPVSAELLREAGILYAPDFVINAGGVIHLAGYETLGWDDAKMAARLQAIGKTLADVFDTADRDGITTDAAAKRLAQTRIDAART